MTAVAVWDQAPTAGELLAERIRDGWRPVKSSLRAGDRVLGHAACLFEGGAAKGSPEDSLEESTEESLEESLGEGPEGNPEGHEDERGA